MCLPFCSLSYSGRKHFFKLRNMILLDWNHLYLFFLPAIILIKLLFMAQAGPLSVFGTFTTYLLYQHSLVAFWQGRGYECCHLNFEGCDRGLCCNSMFCWTSQDLLSDTWKVIWCYWKLPHLSVPLIMASCVASSGCVVRGKVSPYHVILSCFVI